MTYDLRIIQHSWSEREPFLLDKPVDMVFADPPYNLGVKYDGDETGDCISDENYRDWTSSVIAGCVHLLRDGGTLWWLCPPEHASWLWPLLTIHGDLLYGRPIIWHERFSQYQSKRLTCDYRMLFPLRIEGPVTFNPDAIREESERQRMGDKRADPRGRVPGHVWRVRRLQGNAKDRVDWHPAQLPPETLERIVSGWTNPGDTVVDAFAGSASMGMACKKLGRKFVGVEQSTTYCDEARKRLVNDQD